VAVSVQTDLPDALATGPRIMLTEQGTTTAIALDGEWDLTKRGAIRGALARQPERLVLDLRDLTLLDATGAHATADAPRDFPSSNDG
jgi:hypothetical protein